MTKKGRQIFQEKIGVTPISCPPEYTNPSDATAIMGGLQERSVKYVTDTDRRDMTSISDCEYSWL